MHVSLASYEFAFRPSIYHHQADELMATEGIH